jgi:hypothetical protein
MKNYPQVSGVTINGSEYLLSQYADYSALILGKNHTSLEQALHIFDYVSLCARFHHHFRKFFFFIKIEMNPQFVFYFPEEFQAKCFSGSNFVLLPILEPTHMSSVLYFNLYKEEKLSKMMVKK